MANPVTWFEIIGPDARAIQKFYRDVFGWTMTPPTGEEMGYYSMLTNHEPGIGGGLGQGGPARVSVYIESADPQRLLDKAVSNGATILMPITTITPDTTIGMFSDPAGNTVAYDRTYTLIRDSRLANIPTGYADGYRRVFSNKGQVLIRGHRCPVVGRVTMNTIMVDVTDFPDVQPSDEVVLFGKQGSDEITQAELEEIAGTLLVDISTLWGQANPKFLTTGSSVK